MPLQMPLTNAVCKRMIRTLLFDRCCETDFLRYREDGRGDVNYSATTVESIGIIRENKRMAGNIAKSLEITESIEIDAPRAKVWATVSDFHNMSWLPGVVKTTGTGGNEPEVAKRQLVLDGGETIDESLINMTRRT